MTKKNQHLIGIIFMVLGILFLFDRLQIWNFTLFFNGWWTLILIIPAILNISKVGFQTGNTVLLMLGTFFLLDAQGVNLQGFLLPAIFIIAGAILFFRKR